MNRKYYEAYDDRYRQVHSQGLRWFDEAPSAIVGQMMQEFHITGKILELGCGEGRDAVFLLKKGFDLLATDISPSAIAFCCENDAENAQRYQVLDCVNGKLDATFDFIYAVAVVHMLVEDEDRKKFYSFIRDHLREDGIALICSMGDGKMEHSTDVSTAFEVQERIHEPTGRKVAIASTSYRAVSFTLFAQEIKENGLAVVKQGLTDIQPDYWKMMYAVVKRQG